MMLEFDGVGDTFSSYTLRDVFIALMMVNIRTDVTSLFCVEPQEARRPGFSWAKIFVPGGANGVELKWKAPSNASNADSFGFNLLGLVMLRDQSPWGVRRSQKAIGESSGRLAIPAVRWFLYV